MRPDLDSLSLFVLAAEARSLTKAAAASHLSLAAASRRITMLEERYRTPLLQRTPRGVMPTDAGAALLRRAKELLIDVDRLQAEMNDFALGSKGIVRVLATTSAITHFLPHDLAAFSTAYPDVRLSIGEAWSEEIVGAVQNLRADVGIVVEGVQTPDLATRPYRSYHIAVVAPHGHPLLAGPFAFSDVLDHELVGLEGQSLMMRSLVEHALLAGKPLALRVQVRSFEAVCRLVQAGQGVGLLPMEPSEGLAEDMKLAIRRLPEDWAERRMLLCFRRERQRSRQVACLIDHLADRLLRGRRSLAVSGQAALDRADEARSGSS